MSLINGDPLSKIQSQDEMLRFLNGVKTDVSFLSGRKFVKGTHSYTLQQIIDKALNIPKKSAEPQNKQIWDRIKSLNENANAKLEGSFLRFIAWIWRLKNPPTEKAVIIEVQLKSSKSYLTVTDAEIVKAAEFLTTDLKKAHEFFSDYGYDPVILRMILGVFNAKRKADLLKGHEGHLLDEASMKTIRDDLINGINSSDIDEADKKIYIKNVKDYLMGHESSGGYYQLGRQAGSPEDKIRYFLYAQAERYHPQAANEIEYLTKKNESDIRGKLTKALGTENMADDPALISQKSNMLAGARTNIRDVAQKLISSERPEYILLPLAYAALNRLKVDASDDALLDALKAKAI